MPPRGWIAKDEPKEPKKRKWPWVVGILAGLAIIGFLMPNNTPTDQHQTYQAPALTVGLLRFTGYYNDAPEGFHIHVSTGLGDLNWSAPPHSEQNFSKAMDCKSDANQVYVELYDASGAWRQGKWFPARCGASWSYFVGVDENDAGLIFLYVGQDT